jgi:hypothetical protein
MDPEALTKEKTVIQPAEITFLRAVRDAQECMALYIHDKIVKIKLEKFYPFIIIIIIIIIIMYHLYARYLQLYT